MDRDINVMKQIMDQKEKDIEKDGLPELRGDVKTLAEEKRFTFDIISVPTDPLR